MDELLSRFLVCMLNIDNTSVEPSKEFASILKTYAENPRREVAIGISHAVKVYQNGSAKEGAALNLGVIIGVLVAHMATTDFDGRAYLKNIVDNTFQEKMKIKNNLQTQVESTSVDLLKEVDTWFENFKKQGGK